ncbi:P protein [Bactrocera dorsalis]|uniref:P protein n=1 Tax=Bactrocera dorsalis TaxID=27457 RepID=A0A6J0RFI2_BACDO|nr:P protein [Bactrocera dorsalis]
MADENNQNPDTNQPKPAVREETTNEIASRDEDNNQTTESGENPGNYQTTESNQDTENKQNPENNQNPDDNPNTEITQRQENNQNPEENQNPEYNPPQAAEMPILFEEIVKPQTMKITPVESEASPADTPIVFEEIVKPHTMKVTPVESDVSIAIEPTETASFVNAAPPDHEKIEVEGERSRLPTPAPSERTISRILPLSAEKQLQPDDIEAPPARRTDSVKSKRTVSLLATTSNVDKIIEEDIHLTSAQKAVLRQFEGMMKKPEHEQEHPELHIEDIIQVKRAWLKPIGLTLVWLMFTVQFIIYRDLPRNPTLVSLHAGERVVINVPAITATAISMSIKGPFLEDGELIYAGRESEANFVFIQAVRTFYDENMTEIITVNIADLWREYLDTSMEIDMIKPRERLALLSLWKNVSKDNYTRMFLNAHTDINETVTIKYNYDSLPVPTEKGLLFALLVLVLLYGLFIFEITNPTLSSLICSTFALAILSILNPKPSFDTILEWIDMPMLALLFSMMIIVAIISDAGMFDFIAVYAYQISKGSVYRLIMNLCFFISLVSAFLNNSTTMLLSSPITIKLCEVSGMNPVSVLIYLMICANVGAAFTPLGSPPNVIITTNSFLQDHGITFGVFVLNMAPCTFLVLLQTYFQLRFYTEHSKLLDHESQTIQQDVVNRGIKRWERASSAIGSFLADDRKLRGVINRAVDKMRAAGKGNYKKPKPDPLRYEHTLAELKKHHGVIDKILLIKCAIVLIFIVSIFMLRSFDFFNVIGFSWTALLGAILLLILADINDYEGLLCRIEWSTLMFLSSFFVLIEVLSRLGFEDLIGENIIKAIKSTPHDFQLLVALLLILWVTAFASCFLNNNPVTQMMVRIVVSIAQIKPLALPLGPLVWALVMGAAFGGNGSLIGASANIVTAGVANKHLYKLTFRSYFLVGFSVMLVNICIASVYLILMYVIISWDGMIFE